MSFSERYLRLCHAISPAELWEIVDEAAREHPLNDGSMSPDSILASTRPIVIYGAGQFARAVVSAWRVLGQVDPTYCVDSDPRKWGTAMDGVPVLDPQVLFDDSERPLVVVAAMATHDIEGVLDEQRIPPLFAERDGSVGFLPGHWLYRHRPEFEQLYASLADDESRVVLLAATKGRMFQRYRFLMQGNLFLRDLATFPQYFTEQIFTFSGPEFLVDCGAFDGDTLVAFFALMERLGSDESRAVALEADSDNMKSVLQTLQRYALSNVEVIEAAVGKDDVARDASDFFNCRERSDARQVQVVTLDRVLEGKAPTLIKMDIEGAELDGLSGAELTISQFHPKLAICVYHETSHLIEIPSYILANHPKYRVFMRHHAPGSLWETVCYATVNGSETPG